MGGFLCLAWAGMLLVAVLAATSPARYKPQAKRAGLWKNTGKPRGRLEVVTVSEITKHAVDREDRVLAELKAALQGFLGERVRLILYGSKARGDYTIESDTDVAIIVQGLTRELKNQILTMIGEIEIAHDTPLSTLVLSKKDFELLKKRERRIALDIEREGIPL